jgi:AbrB family looped-hinge helix DNA binding protein
MKVHATVTSKGQITLPVAARRALSLQHGDRLEVSVNEFMHSISLTKTMSLDDLHAMNKKALARSGKSLKGYKSGDGFRYHVAKKYGLHS